MKKKELSKILDLIVNEEYTIAKENILRVLKEETDKLKQDELDRIQQEKDTIDYEATLEKTDDINSIAAAKAASDVTSGELDLAPISDVNPESASSVDKEDVDPNDVNYRFNDLKSDIDILRNKFLELMNKEEPKEEEIPEETLQTDMEEDPAEGELAEDKGYRTIYSVSWSYPISKDLFDRLKNSSNLGQLVAANGTESRGYVNYQVAPGMDMSFKTKLSRILNMFDIKNVVKVSSPMEIKKEAIEEMFDSIFDSDIVNDLLEEYSLTDVKLPNNEDGEEVGNGKKIPQNDKSVLADDESTEQKLGGTPIVIDTDSHDGYALQTPPEVKGDGIKNASSSTYKEIPTDGDPKAILNSKKNIGSLDSQSPIPGNQGK